MATEQTFYRYRTVDGDRWDMIAQEFYGDPFDYVGIMQVNPAFAGAIFLPSGQIINVPVREQSTQRQRVLPPWER